MREYWQAGTESGAVLKFPTITMSWWRRILLGTIILFLAAAAGLYWYISGMEKREPSRVAYGEHCASCHGKQLEGSTLGPSLLASTPEFGDGIDGLIRSIAGGPAEHGAYGWGDGFEPAMIKALALYISERRQQFPAVVDSYDFAINEQTLDSMHHRFRVELFSQLAGRPYSMAPLPDGRILVSEKVRGVSIVDSNGAQGAPIVGTPRTWRQLATVRNSYVGLGWSLEVALHPEFVDNGWVYLSHTDRCQFDCGSILPVSMVRVVRGRIEHGRWIDEQVIWSVHKDYYTVVPDGVAAGRLAFDQQGHLFVSVGGKSAYRYLHVIDTPYGKIHRVRDDGSIPEDNPFWMPEGERPASSTRHTVWSYGHRTAQGLATHPESGALWNTEMGPRGGDEVNRISRGGNYGWPLYTNGLDYNAEPLTIGIELGLDFPIEDTVLPVVDFTPAPAISNFTFHRGDRFPHWSDDLLIGSLKAKTLYRLRLRRGELVEREKLVTDLGRIRDVEMGADGLVYLLIEHSDGGSIVRLVPAQDNSTDRIH